MAMLIRTLAYVLGVAYWMYLSVPRFDVERRNSPRYRKALGLTRDIWIGSCCVMLVLVNAFPVNGVALSLGLSLATAFVSYMILDEIE